MLNFLTADFSESFAKFFSSMGIASMPWGNVVMILVSFLLMYLAIKKKYEPLLLLTIAFGMLCTNLPGANMFNSEIFAGGHIDWQRLANSGGLLDFLYLGVKLGIYPCLIFVGVGAMTDFGPLIANPKSFMLGAAAQLGIFLTFIGASAIGFTPAQSASIGIIGGADGPTAIYLTSKLAPELLGPIAVAAYSYMALVPLIQPPIMRALTTRKERQIRMKQLRPVSKTEKILFPLLIAVIISLLLPSAAPLIGCLMLGNLFRECGVCDRLSDTAQNAFSNIITLLLGITIAFQMQADQFVQWETLMIMALGLFAFVFDTVGGVMCAKVMNLFSKNKINPMVGAAGISAFPMSARVIEKMGIQEDPSNHLLMHAVGANVSGQIASATIGGLIIGLVQALI